MEQLNNLIDKILANRLLTHVLYWVSSVILWWIIGSIGDGTSIEAITNKLCYLPSQMLAAYFLMYYQVPKLLYKKKYVAFLGSFFLGIYVTAVIARFLKIYVYETVLGVDQDKEPIIDILTDIPALLGQYVVWIYFFAIFTLLVKLVKGHFEEKEEIESLAKDKAEAELGFLKAQLHPHFLFNTLNNLYTLTLYKSDEAPEIVRKLAEMLDYSLYQGNAKEILLSKEIELIQNYIDLELLRYGDRLALTFNHQIDDAKATIAPLVLLSMVENAFKHGASGDHGRPKIQIDLRVKKEQLFFKVFNTKPKVAQVDKTNFKKGIGSNNVKRQLELIYPNQHQLKTVEQSETYEVTLDINLAANRAVQLAI